MKLHLWDCPAKGLFGWMLSKSLSRRSQRERECSRLFSCTESQTCTAYCCMSRNSSLRKLTFCQITASQQWRGNKTTAASLSFLHPSVHHQNWSNKHTSTSFLFLTFCHFLLGNSHCQGANRKRRHTELGKKMASSKLQPVKEVGTQIRWPQLRYWVILKTYPGGSGREITIYAPLNVALYCQFLQSRKEKTSFAQLVRSLRKYFQQPSPVATSLHQEVIFLCCLLLC